MAELRLNDKVLRRFGLMTQPFRSVDECEDLFRSTSSDMLINSIIQQLSANNLIQLVIGEQHSGKSCFCRRLLCEAPPELVLHYFKAQQRPHIDDLFKALLAPPTNKKTFNTHELAADAARQVFRQLRDKQQPVLLVDDAHQLSPPVLRMLFRFLDSIAKQNRGTLKVVLIGERKLQEKWHTLGNAAPADEKIHASLLRPLSRQETIGFLEAKFVMAGAAKHPFSNRQLQIIQQDAGGLPGKIERRAYSILSYGESRFSKTAIFKAAAIVAVLSATIFYIFNQFEKPLASAAIIKTPAVEHVPPSTEATKQDEPEFIASPLDNAVTDDATDENTLASPNQTDVLAAPTSEEDPEVTTQPYRLRDSDWLQQWPADYYVIQIAGSLQSEKLIQLAKSITLEKDLIFHTSLRNGEIWYALLYGVFPDRESARQAVLQLPPELRETQPWPRPVGTLINK